MTKKTDNQSLGLEKSLTKTDLISHLATLVDLPRKKVDELFAALPNVLSEHLQKGLDFSFLGLVKFYTTEKAATSEREIRNPFTGKMVTLPAKPSHKAVRVKPLKKLKEMVS